jgi:hypothetical protein
VDHPDTLTSAFHLAAELAELGEYQAAMGVTQAQHQAQMAELARIGSSRVLMPRHV